jgi:thioredoxin-like negative regulator of GroEL
VADHLVLTILKEMRAEASASREETRTNFADLFHRLDLIEALVNDVREQLTSVEARLP